MWNGRRISGSQRRGRYIILFNFVKRLETASHKLGYTRSMGERLSKQITGDWLGQNWHRYENSKWIFNIEKEMWWWIQLTTSKRIRCTDKTRTLWYSLFIGTKKMFICVLSAVFHFWFPGVYLLECETLNNEPILCHKSFCFIPLSK